MKSTFAAICAVSMVVGSACSRQHPNTGTINQQFIGNPPVRGRFVQEKANGPGVIKCDSLIGEFTMDEDTRMSNAEASTLCSCVEDRYAVKGWEPEVLSKIKAGEKDWRTPALISRIGKAITSCGKDYSIG